MNKSWTKLGLGVCALSAIVGSASAQKASNAERGLVGVNLYDSGAKVVSLYGSPDEIQAVSIGTTTTGGGGGFGGPGGAGGPGFGGPGGGAPGGGGRGGPPGRGGGGAAGGAVGADWSAPYSSAFGFGSEVLRQAMAPGLGGKGGRDGGSPTGPPAGYQGGPPPGYGGAPGGAPSAGNGATEITQYTRWVYNRAGSKYGFILDNQGRVVQIEAIGMQNNRVKTRKGLGFGSTFAQLIKSYGNPDGYEVGGDSILVKYLVNKKVAFRLTRLVPKKPHVVTGIVVSAGKV